MSVLDGRGIFHFRACISFAGQFTQIRRSTLEMTFDVANPSKKKDKEEASLYTSSLFSFGGEVELMEIYHPHHRIKKG